MGRRLTFQPGNRWSLKVDLFWACHCKWRSISLQDQPLLHCWTVCAGSSREWCGFYREGDKHFSQGCPLKCFVWRGTCLVLVWVVPLSLQPGWPSYSPFTKKVRKIPPFLHMEYWGMHRNEVTEICDGQLGFWNNASWCEEPAVEQEKRLSYFCCFSLKDK